MSPPEGRRLVPRVEAPKRTPKRRVVLLLTWRNSALTDLAAEILPRLQARRDVEDVAVVRASLVLAIGRLDPASDPTAPSCC